MESGGRSPEERREAADARARARRGEPPATGDDELPAATGRRGADEARTRADATRQLGRRHYGGPDIYLRRRLIAGAAVIILIIAIFLLVGGC